MRHKNLRQRQHSVKIEQKTFNGLLIGFICLIALFTFSESVSANEIVEFYNIPEYSSGLAWDGDLIWFGGVGPKGDWIRAFNPEVGEIVDSIRAPVQDCMGLAFFESRLAYISPRSDSTFFVSREGYEVGFSNPQENLGGLGVDGNTLWTATYSLRNGTLYQLDNHGDVLLSMPFTGVHSRDIAYHRGRVYVSDRIAQGVRIVNPESGAFIRTFGTPGMNPDGLTSDGEYLWLMDDGDDKEGDRLYKILVRPDGSMRMSRVNYNFGSVVVGRQKFFDLWVYNDGATEAELTELTSRDGNEDIFIAHRWAFRDVIAPGDSARLRIEFSPAYEDSVHIEYGLTYDLDRQTYWIDFRGKGVRRNRDILVHNRVLDFGMTRCGQYVRGSNLRYLEIENNGGDPLTIEELRFSNQSFYYGFYDFPITFEEPGLYRIPIFFEPEVNRNAAYSERVSIFSDDPDSPEIIVSLQGMTTLSNYNGGETLWWTIVGNREMPVPRTRAIQDIDDVTGDELADVIIASNDFTVAAYHASATRNAIPIWRYKTDANPWRQGLVHGQNGLSEGGDWDFDDVHDVVFGLEGGAKQVIALSGRTGEELWIFDAHNMNGGGGNVIFTNGKNDFSGDDVRDVIAAVKEEDDQHSTNALVALNGFNGSVLWTTALDDTPIKCLVLNDFTGDNIDDVIALLSDGTVVGVDGHRGRIVWESHINGRVMSMFAMRGDVNDDGSVDIGFVTYEEGITVMNGSNGVELSHLEPDNYYDELRAGISINDVNGNGSPDIVFGDELVVRAIDGLTTESVWDSLIYVGSPVSSMNGLFDYDEDGLIDYVVGTQSGRVYAYSGNGRDGLWSYSNVGEGHEFELVFGSRDVDGNGEMDVFGSMVNGTVYCFAGSWVGIENSVPFDLENNLTPSVLMVDPAYPNPFNSSVVVPIRLAKTANLNIRVVDILGREVYQMKNDLTSPGNHRILWNGVSSSGMNLPSGMYYMEVNSASQNFILPVELLR